MFSESKSKDDVSVATCSSDVTNLFVNNVNIYYNLFNVELIVDTNIKTMFDESKKYLNEVKDKIMKQYNVIPEFNVTVNQSKLIVMFKVSVCGCFGL